MKLSIELATMLDGQLNIIQAQLNMANCAATLEANNNDLQLLTPKTWQDFTGCLVLEVEEAKRLMDEFFNAVEGEENEGESKAGSL